MESTILGSRSSIMSYIDRAPLLSDYKYMPEIEGSAVSSSHRFIATTTMRLRWRSTHLRHPFRRDERPSFYVSKPSLCQPPDQFNLRRGTNRLLLILQPISRSHLHKLDICCSRSLGLVRRHTCRRRKASQRSWLGDRLGEP